MIEFVLLLIALFAWPPALDAGQDSRLNACYRVDQEMRQRAPCKPEEIANWRMLEPDWRPK